MTIIDETKFCAQCDNTEPTHWGNNLGHEFVPVEVVTPSPNGTSSEEYMEASVQRMLGEFLDTDALENLPEPEPLVGDLLFLDSLARLVGPSGTFKSFIALDFAGHVGTGMAWHGRYVRQGSVLYLVAEGVKGIKKRVRAWEQHYGVRMENVYFLPRPVQAKDPQWEVLTEACRRMDVKLIVVDTQARVTTGVDENSNTEMGKIIDRLELMRGRTGACVMPIHHTGHLGEHGRGASAVKGALDSELLVSRRGDSLANITVTLKTGKQKDEEEGDNIDFSLRQIKLDGLAKPDGSPMTSVVLLTGETRTPGQLLAARLDDLGIPEEYGRRKVQQELQRLEIKVGNDLLQEAVNIRKARVEKRSGDARTTPEHVVVPIFDSEEDETAGHTGPGPV